MADINQEAAEAILTSIKREVVYLDNLREDTTEGLSEQLRNLAEAYALVTEHRNRSLYGNTQSNGYRQA